MPIKLKHFLVLLYMVSSVFIAKAQEPLLYYINTDVNWHLEELKYQKGQKKFVVKFPETNYNGAHDRTAFDAFNGRYFMFSNGCFITEIDVNTGEIKYHHLPKATQLGPRNLFYEPFTNSIIYLDYDTSTQKNALNVFSLKASALETAELNFTNTTGNFILQTAIDASNYNYNREEFILPTYERDSSSYNWFYYKYDLEGNYKGLLTTFKSKRFINALSWNGKQYVGIYADTLLVEIKEKGFEAIDTLKNHKVKYRASGNKFDKDKNIYYWFLEDTNSNTLLYLTDTNFNNAESFEYRGVHPEIHTFEKPYIRVEKNAYTSTYGKNYRWFWNGQVIENSDNQTYEPKQCGWYSVEVTHLDGRVDTSAAVYNNINDAHGNSITGDFAAAYPNPFKNDLNIRYKTCRRDNVTFRIYNSIGKEIYSTTTGVVEAGDNEFSWNSRLSGLRYGMYFLQIYSGNELISTHKIVKKE